MASLKIGSVCMKLSGREAGRYCVVLKKMDSQFVLITGPKNLTYVKRRKCNIDHLEPTQYLLKLDQEASDKNVIEAWDKAGLLKKFNLKKPSPEIVKETEKKLKKKPEKPKKEKSKKEKPKQKKSEKKKAEKPKKK